MFRIGTDDLWTMVRTDGGWPDPKFFWWREGYVASDEQRPDLKLVANRLDAYAPPIVSWRTTNAFASDIGQAMLTGIPRPDGGCWRITGEYHGYEVSFVVWVGSTPQRRLSPPVQTSSQP
jgi:hypothetical protein